VTIGLTIAQLPRFKGFQYGGRLKIFKRSKF